MSKDSLISWVERASKLSLIKIRDDEREDILNSFQKIIDFFNELLKINVDDVEPLFMAPKQDGLLREEKPEPSLNIDDVMINVKEKEDGYIKGPRTA